MPEPEPYDRLTIQRFASHGQANRVDAGTEEPLHLHSQLEYRHWMLLRVRRDVVKVESQVQLTPRDETTEIAIELQVPPPRFSPRSPCMTTDLLAYLRFGGPESYLAINCKYSKDAVKIRNSQLLAIEKEYWRRRNVRLVQQTECDITPTQVENLQRARQYRYRDSVSIEDADAHAFSLQHQIIAQPYRSLLQIHARYDNLHGFAGGTAASLMWWAVAHRLWHIDFARRIDPMMLACDMPWAREND
jgi:hypothetical protein